MIQKACYHVCCIQLHLDKLRVQTPHLSTHMCHFVKLRLSNLSIYSLSVPSSSLFVIFIKRARHIIGISVNISPILSMNIVKNKTKASDQSIAFSRTIRFKIQATLLRQQTETKRFWNRCILRSTKRRCLLTNIDIHNIGQYDRMQFTQLNFLVLPGRTLPPSFSSPRNGITGKLQSNSLWFSSRSMGNNDNSLATKLRHGILNDSFVARV